MVELKLFADRGLQTGEISNNDPALGKPNYVVLTDVHRICAPTNGQAYPIIFWTKESESDNQPTAGKIVSYLAFHRSACLSDLTVWVHHLQCLQVPSQY
jgi:hypothetical protein